MTKKEALVQNLNDMNKYKEMKFDKLCLKAINTIKPSIRRSIMLSILFLMFIYPSYKMVISNNTGEFIKKVIETSNSIVLALFAVIFTGYVLFQALINRNTLKIMFIVKNEKNNNLLFSDYNLYFFIMTIFYLFLIVTNYILLIIIPFINLNVFYYKDITEISASILISLWIVVNLFAIIEVKSFIFNLFQCFNISATSTMIDALKNYDDNLNEQK